jgi:hypothetical protein
MGCGMAARIPPNFPAQKKMMSINNFITRKYISISFSKKNQYFQQCLPEALTKNREEDHENSRNLDYPPTSNSC